MGSRKDKSKDLRVSNHNTLSLKENLKEGRQNMESRTTKKEDKRSTKRAADTARTRIRLNLPKGVVCPEKANDASFRSEITSPSRCLERRW